MTLRAGDWWLRTVTLSSVLFVACGAAQSPEPSAPVTHERSTEDEPAGGEPRAVAPEVASEVLPARLQDLGDVLDVVFVDDDRAMLVTTDQAFVLTNARTGEVRNVLPNPFGHRAQVTDQTRAQIGTRVWDWAADTIGPIEQSVESAAGNEPALAAAPSPTTDPDTTGVRFELDSDSCVLHRQRPGDERPTVVAPAPWVIPPDDDMYAQPMCTRLVPSSGGRRLAFGREEGLYLFDTVTGEPTLAPSEGASSFGRCLATPGASFEHGLRLQRNADTPDLVGCAAPIPSVESDEDSDPLFEVLGVSANHRYTLVAVPLRPREMDDYEPVPVQLSLGTAGSRRPLRVPLACEGMVGHPSTGGAIMQLSCQAQGWVSDNGRTVVLADGAVRIIDVRRSTTRRIPVDHPDTIVSGLSGRYVQIGTGSGALLDVQSGAHRPFSRWPRLDGARRHILLVEERTMTVVDLETDEAHSFEADEEELWGLTRDGESLVRMEPSSPLVTLAITSGERTSFTLPAGVAMDRRSLSGDARWVAACREGSLELIPLSSGPDRAPPARFEVSCPAGASTTFIRDDRFVVVSRLDGSTLVRVHDGATLELRATATSNSTWVALAPNGAFWAPLALLPSLRIRGRGTIQDAVLSPAEGSPHYDPDLVTHFLETAP